MPDFTSGGIDADVINPLRINQITFEQFEIEDEDEDKNNSVMVTVDYPTSYDLDCNVTQKFANTNATYTNMTGQPIGTNLSQSYFNFTNFTNEVIVLYCYDDVSGDSATYEISNDDFPLLDMFDDFRNGTYGTKGQLGYLDLITMIVIIFSMVGFNRKDPIVGVIINIMIIGSTGYVGVIEPQTAMYSALATATMFIVFSKRSKD